MVIPEYIKGDAVKSFVRDLGHAKDSGAVYHYTGAAEEFNDPRVPEAVRQAAARGIQLSVVAAFVLATGSGETNGLLDLNRKGAIASLHFRRIVASLGAFRVTETPESFAYYRERARLPLAEVEVAKPVVIPRENGLARQLVAGLRLMTGKEICLQPVRYFWPQMPC